MLNTPHIETASGGVANFKTDMIAPLKGCKINFLPKQSGSGDPSPTNIRPISGWDGVTIYRSGVNIWDGEMENGGIDDTTGEKISASQVRSANYIPVKQNTNYYASFADVVGGGGLWAYAYDFDKNFIGRMRPIDIGSGNNTANKVFKTLDGTSYMLIKMQGGTRYDRISINYPSTDTQYHPYTASTFPISWTQQGTFYGGYVDLVSGELVAECTGYTFTGDETFYTTGSWIIANPSLVAAWPYKGYCSHYPYAPYGRGKIGVMYNERSCTFDGNIYDQSGWKQFCKDQYDNGTPLTIVYMIKEPIHYSLTPAQIKTLKGINNIYSDADSAEVKFWTH